MNKNQPYFIDRWIILNVIPYMWLTHRILSSYANHIGQHTRHNEPKKNINFIIYYITLYTVC